MSIQIRKISKQFGSFKALAEVDLTIESGELVALLGPSGSGKTTLLRIIAGLECADQGTILFHGDDISRQNVKDRGVGFVFQHYALFRHMSVYENIAFGLKVRPRSVRPDKAYIDKKVSELLALIRLEGIASRYPAQLSGGQRQRVALARALAIEPKMLLLDEPFGALDAKVRRELRQWIRDLHDKLHMTSIFVTHDQEEALEVADRVVVMNHGRIEQIGTPEEVYHHPVNEFVCEFLGNVNYFHGRYEQGRLYVAGAPLDLKEGVAAGGDNESARVYIRPHMLEIEKIARPNSIRTRVKFINAAGPTARVEVLSDSGDSIRVELTQERFRLLNLQKNEEVFVTFRDAKIFSGDYAI